MKSSRLSSQWYTLFLLPLLVFSLSGALRAQTPIASESFHVRANYVKGEVMIPMRDGVKLFTAIYAPKDAGRSNRTYPVMLTRTPYSVAPYEADVATSDGL